MIYCACGSLPCSSQYICAYSKVFLIPQAHLYTPYHEFESITLIHVHMQVCQHIHCHILISMTICVRLNVMSFDPICAYIDIRELSYAYTNVLSCLLSLFPLPPNTCLCVCVCEYIYIYMYMLMSLLLSTAITILTI